MQTVPIHNIFSAKAKEVFKLYKNQCFLSKGKHESGCWGDQQTLSGVEPAKPETTKKQYINIF